LTELDEAKEESADCSENFETKPGEEPGFFVWKED
jgi:hypothetical protein